MSAHERTVEELATAIGEYDTPLVVMFAGVPGSGKTHLARPLAEHLLETAYFSGDEVRRLRGDEANQTDNASVWREVNRGVAQRIAMGNSAVVDGVHETANRRIESVRTYRDMGAVSVLLVYVQVEREVAERRVATRGRRVGKEFFNSAYVSLVADPPHVKEGFDAVFVVENSVEPRLAYE